MSKEKILWALFIVQVPLSVLGITGIVDRAVLVQITTYLPLVLVGLHACWTLGARRGFGFIALAGFTGWAAEAFSLHYGTLFGGKYTYPTQASFLGVPLAIIAYWVVFIYMGYWLVATFLLWLNRKKPSRGKNSLMFLGATVLADGLTVTAIDLFMDPTSVRAGAWTWAHGGPYFGVPVGNFVGWFLVTIVVTGLFRLLEYHSPQPAPKVHDSVLLLPVLGYGLAGVMFLMRAVSYHLLLLAFIGTLIVILPAIINAGLYARFKHLHQRLS